MIIAATANIYLSHEYNKLNMNKSKQSFVLCRCFFFNMPHFHLNCQGHPLAQSGKGTVLGIKKGKSTFQGPCQSIWVQFYQCQKNLRSLSHHKMCDWLTGG